MRSSPSGANKRGTEDERGARVLVVAGAGASQRLLDAVHDAGAIGRATEDPLAALELAATFQPELVLLQPSHPDAELCDPINKLKQRHGCTCVLVLPVSSGNYVTLADRCDADAVVLAPLDGVELRRLLLNAGANAGKARNRSIELPSLVVGSSPEIREVWRLVMVAARSHSSVVIRGDTGVGKELVARALHRFSTRRAGPFVAVNCAAIPETLLESELFGHEKGAFTGAAALRKGRFELAHEGTLFLDEIGDLPLGVQAKLLRVLQERTFERVGGTQSVSIDVRVIAATHRDLEAEVKRGGFRADLFYRLNVVSIRVPALHERKSDILGLWQHFLEEGALREGREPLETHPEVSRLLMRHDWPGNVREVHNAAQHALTVARGKVICPEDLPKGLLDAKSETPKTTSIVGMTMKEIERIAILETYEAMGTVKAAAEVLGISPRKVHYRLGEYRREGWLATRSSRHLPMPEDGSEIMPEIPRRPSVRILLAEDDDEVRWALSDFLKTEGYEVIAVPDGRALLEHLGAAMLLEQRDAPPDIIVTDVRMPGLTGMQLLESVRRRGWGTPVVLISAFGDDDTKRKADALGAAAFLDKPIDVSRLQNVIDRSVAH